MREEILVEFVRVHTLVSKGEYLESVKGYHAAIEESKLLKHGDRYELTAEAIDAIGGFLMQLGITSKFLSLHAAYIGGRNPYDSKSKKFFFEDGYKDDVSSADDSEAKRLCLEDVLAAEAPPQPTRVLRSAGAMVVDAEQIALGAPI